MVLGSELNFGTQHIFSTFIDQINWGKVGLIIGVVFLAALISVSNRFVFTLAK